MKVEIKDSYVFLTKIIWTRDEQREERASCSCRFWIFGHNGGSAIAFLIDCEWRVIGTLFTSKDRLLAK
jgi:hypothetical protein